MLWKKKKIRKKVRTTEVNKIVTVVLKKDDISYADEAYQWNYGQILRIQGGNLPKAVEVHFSLEETSGTSVTRIGTTTDGVTEAPIPDSLLENNNCSQGYTIYAYIYLEDGTAGRTEYEIAIPVKARTKPEVPETPEEPELFRETVKAVNDAADRAEQAEQNAKASATEAGKYAASASESAASAEKIKEDALREIGEKKQKAIEAIQEQEETSVGEIINHTDNEIQRILNQTAESKGELEQTITNAGVSKKELDESIQTASDTKTALDKSVELSGTAKTELDTSTQKAGEAKTALDGSTNTAGEMQETLSATVKQAGALDTSLSEKIEVGTQLNEDITASGEKAVQDIQAAGSEQLGKMQAVAEEFTADREQIATNKEDIGSLKEDLDYKIDKTAVGEIELKFTNSGYVKASDGTISSSKEAQNTGFCRIDGVSRIIAHVNLSEAGAKIAFYSRNKEYLKDISIIPAITDPNYIKTDLDITSDVYANAKYCIISNYGSETKMAKVIGTIAPYSAKVTADEAKVTADEAVTPYKTTFFEGLNIGAPENVENVQRIPYNDGLVDSVSNTWSLIFKCKPNTDYYIHIPNRNRRNAVESETDKFVDGETYTILPTSVINYSGVDVVKITTGENAKRIMFYYFNGSYDYDANKDKIIILENKWVAAPYVHIPLQYLPKEIVKKSKHYGTFAIIGDSYSSFKGYMANANAATWYPASDHNMNDTNDVENVEQTWWYKFANNYNSRLLENNSWSGSTIAYDSYSEGLDDGKETSFIQRMNLITTPQLILIYGGTNDSWVAGDTKRDDFLGEYKYSDFSESDFIYFRPALAYLLAKLKHKHIGAKIIFMLNSSLSNIKESVHEICAHYEIGVCEITDIALAHSHPTSEGMTTIAEQIIEFLEVS